jgi:hypothetical protein
MTLRDVAARSIAYADPSEPNHGTLLKATRPGKLEVFIERECVLPCRRARSFAPRLANI